MYKFEPSTAQACASLRHEYLKSLSAPKDGMWEAFVDMGAFFEIKTSEKTIGYLVLNQDRYIIQFYVLKDAAAVFSHAIEKLEIAGAFVATCETDFMCLSIDMHKSLSINALMYQASLLDDIEEPQFNTEFDFRVLNKEDMENAVSFAIAAIGAPEDWLRGYYSERIDRGELHGLFNKGNLIATGECRISPLFQGVADIGMIVAPTHRKKGIATGVLVRLLQLCREKNLSPICSTEKDNFGAQKAIEKAGFEAYHRILDVKF